MPEVAGGAGPGAEFSAWLGLPTGAGPRVVRGVCPAASREPPCGSVRPRRPLQAPGPPLHPWRSVALCDLAPDSPRAR